jgi:hypothetical protein
MWAGCGAAICLVCVSLACDRSAPSTRPSKPASTSPPVTVGETFDRLREWHRQGAYTTLRTYIDPATREEVIDLLIAVDELLAANAGANRAVHAACPTADVKRYDLSMVADNLDLFSRQVELVKVEESAEQAVAIAEVSGRLPLDRIQFRRIGGVWGYVPEPANHQIIASIRAMSRSLEQIALVFADRKATPEEVDAEYRARLLPKIAKMRELASPASRPNG